MNSRNPSVAQNRTEATPSECTGVARPSGPTEEVTAVEPYVGPRPFDVGDQAIFFGRNREISEIASLVLAHPVVLVYGGSGTGKTSLVNAGILPSLRAKGFQDTRTARVFGPMPVDFTEDEVWRISNLYLFNTMTSLASSQSHEPRQFLDLNLHEFIQEYVLPDRNREDDRPEQNSRRPEHALLMFDQLEELFTCYAPRWKEREDFFRQIADVIRAVNEYHSLRVVFVMREEFLSHIEPFACLLPEELQTRYRLQGLCASSANHAIKGPVQNVAPNVSFEPDAIAVLVHRLRTFKAACAAGELREVQSECVEPMHLQLVCQKLWRRAMEHWEESPVEKNRITRELVERHADVDAALQEFYDEAVHQTVRETSVPEWRLREWCGKLITQDDTRGMLHRGEHHAEGVPNEAADELGSRHLVRTEERFGGLWYELTHDRFIEPIKRSNAAFQISSKRKNLQEAAISVIVLALTDLRRSESSINEAVATPGPESASGEPANRLSVDPVRTLEHPEVRFFLTHLFASDARSDEKYLMLTRLFELQDRLSRKIWEHEGPEEDTPDAMQKMVAAIARHEGVWKSEELKRRTLDSVRCGVEYIRKSRYEDERGWRVLREDACRLWATGHALLALCSARDLPEFAQDTKQMIDEGVGWVISDLREWFVESFPPPEQRSVYEVGLGLICLHEALPLAENRRAAVAPLIKATLHGLCGAQNADGGWDATIARQGHVGTTGVFSDVGATSWAVQSLARWNGASVDGSESHNFEAAVRKGIDWLLQTQNEDGSWSDGSCQPGTGLRLTGNPSITKTCDAIRGVLCAKHIEFTAAYDTPVRRAVAWLRHQERRLPVEKGESVIGWAWEDKASRDTHSITTCMTLETLVQVDEVSLPLFTANAQWLMDSQDRVLGSPTYGAWPQGDSFRSTLSLIEYYKRIVTSPFFALSRDEMQHNQPAGGM